MLVSVSAGLLAPTIYAGVDEAGYGRRLGPLCVGFSAFEVAAGANQNGELVKASEPPDLWRLLRPVVSRAGSASARGARSVAIDDSKRLTTRNRSGRNFEALETGVLCFLSSLGVRPTTDAELLDALGARLEASPWYAGPADSLPRDAPAPRLTALADQLADLCRQRGVRLVDLGCEAIGEQAFNEGVHRSGSKAEVSFAAIGRHLRRLWERRGRDAAPIVVIDRQGGRVMYGPRLAALLPEASVRVVKETPMRSEYEVVERARGGAKASRRMRVRFEVDADASHLPTALASMAAKLARETAMRRFNRYWTRRWPDLAPTAGYGVDAKRWLRQADHLLSRQERAALVRRA